VKPSPFCGRCRHFIPPYLAPALGGICQRHGTQQGTTSRACRDYSARTDPEQMQLPSTEGKP